jgi:hypothetical protein
MRICKQCGERKPRYRDYARCLDCVNARERTLYAQKRLVEKKCGTCGIAMLCNLSKSPKCGPCNRAYAKHRYANNIGGTRDKALANNIPEIRRVQKLRRDYGITEEQVGMMLFLQECKCALCRVELTMPENRKGQKSTTMAVDHDHVTGDVRGVLCIRCNTALGGFRDDAVALRRAADYVSASVAL